MKGIARYRPARWAPGGEGSGYQTRELSLARLGGVGLFRRHTLRQPFVYPVDMYLLAASCVLGITQDDGGGAEK